ncbi:MAG: hypothetical protein AAB902_00925 [Patescibacteria group bacterium]
MKNFSEQRRGPESRRHPKEMLGAMLDNQSQKTNEAVRNEHGLIDLLARDATLNPKGYVELYGDGAVQADKNFVRERELGFSSARNPKVQAFYRENYGAQTEDDIIAKWRENKMREKNGQMEMAITVLLSQKLGKDFLVVRTAPYDDYKNGVDNLILNRITGEVVGAFDEVHEGGDGRRTEEKKEKIQKIAKQGGAKIRYGLRFADRKLLRASLEGVPVFYLGLESGELVELVQGLSENNSRITDKIFYKLLASLAAQHAELEKSVSAPGLRARLASFGRSLSLLMNTEERLAA